MPGGEAIAALGNAGEGEVDVAACGKIPDPVEDDSFLEGEFVAVLLCEGANEVGIHARDLAGGIAKADGGEAGAEGDSEAAFELGLPGVEGGEAVEGGDGGIFSEGGGEGAAKRVYSGRLKPVLMQVMMERALS